MTKIDKARHLLRILEGCPIGSTTDCLITVHDVEPKTIACLIQSGFATIWRARQAGPFNLTVNWVRITDAGRAHLTTGEPCDR